MAESLDPTVQRLALRLQLRRIRKDTGRTQREVAEALDWSPSKLLRIESGEVGVTTLDVKALLREYGVKDQRRVDELTRMAKSSRRQTAGAYDDVLSKELQTLLKYERSAWIIRQFQPNLIPGL